MNTIPNAPLTPGTTVHLLRGSRYSGAWTLETVGAEHVENFPGWYVITADNGRWMVREIDAFATEADARAEARNRRAPRGSRKPTTHTAITSGEWGMAVQIGRMCSGNDK
ncbi:MAG: hypothetical protein ACRDXE_04880 [Acidimicrobiales bacterium]